MLPMETNIDKQLDVHKNVIKKAWIIEETAVVSFHEVDDSDLYEAEEDEFWTHILNLINQGYRIQQSKP